MLLYMLTHCVVRRPYFALSLPNLNVGFKDQIAATMALREFIERRFFSSFVVIALWKHIWS